MNGWAVFGIIVFLIILALAVVFLILWLTKGGKANSKKELAINGLNVTLTSIPVAPLPTPMPMPPMNDVVPVASNTFMSLNPVSPPTTSPTPFGVTATWTSVGNSKDKVTMYADTKPIDLDADGKPEAAKNPKVLIGGPVDGSARTVSIPNLAARTVYYIQVVVTNGDIPGYNSELRKVYTGGVPQGNFVITEFDAKGAIEYDGKDVKYASTRHKGFDDVWTYDAAKFTLTRISVGSEPSAILYNNNGVLAAAPPSSTISSASSEWVYNNDNKWCLKSNPSLCMNIEVPFTTSTPVVVTSAGKSQWINHIPK